MQNKIVQYKNTLKKKIKIFLLSVTGAFIFNVYAK